MSSFMGLKLEDGEDPDTLFFEADNLREEVQHNGNTISGHACKDAIIRAIPNNHSDVEFAVHRDRFPL